MASGELGIGTRVRLGWTPDGNVPPYLSHDPRMQEGIITDGPFAAGDIFVRPQRPRVIVTNMGPSTRWRVETDCGESVFPVEWVIFPIDGEDQTQREAESVETA